MERQDQEISKIMESLFWLILPSKISAMEPFPLRVLEELEPAMSNMAPFVNWRKHSIQWRIIILDGTAGPSTTSNLQGTRLTDSSIMNSGSGTITITGIGGDGTNNNMGFFPLG